MSAQPPKRTTARRRLDFSRKRSAATAALGVAPVAASAAGSAVASAASSSADVGAASSSAPPAKRQHLESDEKQQPAVTETPLEKWQKKIAAEVGVCTICHGEGRELLLCRYCPRQDCVVCLPCVIEANMMPFQVLHRVENGGYNGFQRMVADIMPNENTPSVRKCPACRETPAPGLPMSGCLPALNRAQMDELVSIFVEAGEALTPAHMQYLTCSDCAEVARSVQSVFMHKLQCLKANGITCPGCKVRAPLLTSNLNKHPVTAFNDLRGAYTHHLREYCTMPVQLHCGCVDATVPARDVEKHSHAHVAYDAQVRLLQDFMHSKEVTAFISTNQGWYVTKPAKGAPLMSHDDAAAHAKYIKSLREYCVQFYKAVLNDQPMTSGQTMIIDLASDLAARQPAAAASAPAHAAPAQQAAPMAVVVEAARRADEQEREALAVFPGALALLAEPLEFEMVEATPMRRLS